MQKNYFLLRDNLESGPYTIDELLLQQLSPSDLVWVEGKSTAWCHPSELSELTTSFSINKSAMSAGQEKPVQKPKRHPLPSKSNIEARAEEIRKKVLSHKPVGIQVSPVSMVADDSLPPYNLKEESINLVYHKKQFRLQNPNVTAAAIMLLFIGGAWFGKDIWMQEPGSKEVVARPLFSGQSIDLSPQKLQSVTEASAFGPAAQNMAADSTTYNLNNTGNVYQQSAPPPPVASNSAAFVPVKKNNEPVENKTELIQPEEKEIEPVTPSPNLTDNKETKEPVIAKKEKDIVKAKKDTVIEKQENKSEEKAVEVKEPEKEEKKGLGKVLKGLFGKKNKDKKGDSSETENN